MKISKNRENKRKVGDRIKREEINALRL